MRRRGDICHQCMSPMSVTNVSGNVCHQLSPMSATNVCHQCLSPMFVTNVCHQGLSPMSATNVCHQCRAGSMPQNSRSADIVSPHYVLHSLNRTLQRDFHVRIHVRTHLDACTKTRNKRIGANCRSFYLRVFYTLATVKYSRPRYVFLSAISYVYRQGYLW